MDRIKIEFGPFGPPVAGDLAVFVGDDLKPSVQASALVPGLATLIERAAKAERFKGGAHAVLAIPAPAGIETLARLLVVGLGPENERGALDWKMVGGALAGSAAGRTVAVVADLPDAQVADAVAALTLGARLRSYQFDRYKTKKTPNGDEDGTTRVLVMVEDVAACRAADETAAAIASGVNLARDLVNEPPNVLFPAEFASRAEALSNLGVEVEVLNEDKLREMGFRALVAVGQGSGHGSRVAIMRWSGGVADTAPLAFVGKGVCFDSGGISIKPAGGMEDMKGDMAGAATVVGLMHALAARKAKVNVVGAIGLTENMPDGNAQRPGDIITTLSGQTVEMVNSDAEGRLVLGDLLWHVQERFKPVFMVDLATLTGAILVALAQDHAGLFSNSDELSARLTAAGLATGEKVWRMPLGPAYDKLIESKFADMKNTGGRHGGSITAAQFIKRFVNDVPWAHLDIAGTGINAPQSEINKSWSAGWGVRLLDRLVSDHYEG